MPAAGHVLRHPRLCPAGVPVPGPPRWADDRSAGAVRPDGAGGRVHDRAHRQDVPPTVMEYNLHDGALVCRRMFFLIWSIGVGTGVGPPPPGCVGIGNATQRGVG